MAMVHIIGAGMAGLSCAVKLVEEGREVAIYETAAHTGGRSRSFKDDSLGCMIDNGSHMLMGGCGATREYMSLIGSSRLITEIKPAAYPFLDLATGERWRLRPGAGRIPFWLLSEDRRGPGRNIAWPTGSTPTAFCMTGSGSPCRARCSTQMHRRDRRKPCGA
jgi:2-polyprenyl-6-methoxyphenol hydroxylase-like FAD-dependent oxidoreductase